MRERGNLADPPLSNLESWAIAAGSAGAFTYTFLQPDGSKVRANTSRHRAMSHGRMRGRPGSGHLGKDEHHRTRSPFPGRRPSF